MAPGVKDQPLLYVPDSFAEEVDVYTYQAGQFVGRLTGFNGPQGECVDKAQNVWITDEFASQVVEYAHGGTSPIATLNDAAYFPDDCAVDPISGDLAVANNTGPNNAGDVAVYRKAKGSPTLYSDGRQMYDVYYCAYDGSGNLFVDGAQFPTQWPWGQFQYAELPKGSASFKNLTFTPPQSIAWQGGVHWDGKRIAVGNLLHGEIYRTAGAKIVETIRVKGARGAFDFFVDGKRVLIGADSAKAAVGAWSYPAGGRADDVIALPDRRDPVATAVVSE
jgi:hypothetical protein